MSFAPGTRFGPYEITSFLGAGGMGAVYRATDTRLNRAVAIKVLQGEAAADAEFRARFQREARAVAALNHPNVCVLHDVGHQNAHDFLVMEMIEGQTLAERVRRGPLPVDQVLKYGIQIADALAAAHGRRLVHRDLKPANIMLTSSSGLKVLDFGLAKLVAGPDAVGAGMTQSIAGTGRGTVLGTPGYIAPEQLLGRDADERSDIFALGAVLFEMTMGSRAFDGQTHPAIVASILEHDPTARLDDSRVPALFKRVIAKCLIKDPDQRWQSAADVAEALRWAGDERLVAPPVGAKTASRRPWIVAAVAVLAAGVSTAMLLLNRPPEPLQETALRASIVPSAGFNFVPRDITGTPPFALSPDGSALVYVAGRGTEPPHLWVRPLNTADARALPGTEDAIGPFWSPDGTQIAFFAKGKLKKVTLADGSLQDLAAVTFDVTGGSWSPDGVILFAGPTADGLYRIPANGGTVERATALDPSRAETGHRWPQFIDDGKSFLFYVRSNRPGVSGTYLVTADNPTPRFVMEGRASATYAEPGYLLFDRNGTLMAQQLIVQTAQLIGEPQVVGDKVPGHVGPSHLPVSASRTGTIAYWNGLGPLFRLEWYDRSGKLLRQTGDPDHYVSPALTPDGKRLLVTRRTSSAVQDLWLADVATNAWTRLTFSPNTTRFGIFSGTGSHVIFTSVEATGTWLMRRPITGAAEPERYVDTTSVWAAFPIDASRDGRWVIYGATSANGWDILAMDMADKKSQSVLATPGNKVQGQFSADGRWLAYASDESGSWEVYVTSFPATAGKWQISSAGGSQPRWSGDGKELFFIATDGSMMSASVRAGKTFESSPPRRLFQSNAMINVAPFRTGYAVSPKGEFLVSRVVSEAVEPITLVHNWTATLRQGTSNGR
jgi:serine/threonine protein kinase/Tol biopolymer transport system component